MMSRSSSSLVLATLAVLLLAEGASALQLRGAPEKKDEKKIQPEKKDKDAEAGFKSALAKSLKPSWKKAWGNARKTVPAKLKAADTETFFKQKLFAHTKDGFAKLKAGKKQHAGHEKKAAKKEEAVADLKKRFAGFWKTKKESPPVTVQPPLEAVAPPPTMDRKFPTKPQLGEIAVGVHCADAEEDAGMHGMCACMVGKVAETCYDTVKECFMKEPEGSEFGAAMDHCLTDDTDVNHCVEAAADHEMEQGTCENMAEVAEGGQDGVPTPGECETMLEHEMECQKLAPDSDEHTQCACAAQQVVMTCYPIFDQCMQEGGTVESCATGPVETCATENAPEMMTECVVQTEIHDGSVDCVSEAQDQGASEAEAHHLCFCMMDKVAQHCMPAMHDCMENHVPDGEAGAAPGAEPEKCMQDDGPVEMCVETFTSDETMLEDLAQQCIDDMDHNKGDHGDHHGDMGFGDMDESGSYGDMAPGE